MPPGGGEHACTEPDHPLATDRGVCDEDAPPRSPSPSPFPASEAASQAKKMRKDELEPQPLGSLPEGPLAEILSRVPYRSLCRFKCVSKPWLALCSDPAIRKRSPQTLSGLVAHDDMIHTSDLVTIGRSQGHLHAWRIDNDDDSQFHVWVLEDSEWTLKHTVKVLELFGRECDEDEEDRFSLFAIHPDRNIIYLADAEEMTVSYDMDSREVQVMCTAKELRGGVPYTPCFAEWSSAGN